MRTRIKSALMTDDATTVMRLLEFTDSAFPVGTFSFSNGLETAAEEGLVHDAATLEQYTQDIVPAGRLHRRSRGAARFPQL